LQIINTTPNALHCPYSNIVNTSTGTNNVGQVTTLNSQCTVLWWWCYPTPSEGWGHAWTPGMYCIMVSEVDDFEFGNFGRC